MNEPLWPTLAILASVFAAMALVSAPGLLAVWAVNSNRLADPPPLWAVALATSIAAVLSWFLISGVCKAVGY